MKHPVDIRVYKDGKGTIREGEYFVKELDFDELSEVQEKYDSKNPGSINDRIVLACLVDKTGKPVFTAQQIKLIRKRINGSHFGLILYVANEVNDFAAISNYAEMYKKNLPSDQS